MKSVFIPGMGYVGYKIAPQPKPPVPPHIPTAHVPQSMVNYPKAAAQPVPVHASVGIAMMIAGIFISILPMTVVVAPLVIGLSSILILVGFSMSINTVRVGAILFGLIGGFLILANLFSVMEASL